MLATDWLSLPVSALFFTLMVYMISLIDPIYDFPKDSLTQITCTFDEIMVLGQRIVLPWTYTCHLPVCAKVPVHKPIEYDYVIVGAGAAGSLVAYRFALAQPHLKIALVEAGGDPLVQSVSPRIFPAVINNAATYNYRSAVNPNHSRVFINGSVTDTGKCLGGSTTTSTLTSICGNDRNFDEWAAMTGDSNWNDANFRSYLSKHENMKDTTITSGKCAKYHSTSGPIPVNNMGDNDWINPTLKQAFQERNYRELDDINCGGPYVGSANVRMYIDDGRRVTTAISILNKLAKVQNFFLLKNTYVTSVITNKDSSGKVTVTGVNARTSNLFCKDFQIIARREVILAAGTYNTPKILLQSGIGRSSDLCSGVNQVLNLNVGYNYQDHVATVHYYTVEDKGTTDVVTQAFQYFATRTGIFGNMGGWNIQAFVNVTDLQARYPDIIYNFARLDKNTPDLKKMYMNSYGYKEEYVDQMVNVNKDLSIIMVSNTLQEPKSRGTIKLGSCTDPLADPIINANFLAEEQDINTLLKGMNELSALMGTNAMKNYGVKDMLMNITECASEVRNSEAFNRCYMRYFSTGERNTCGTTKMGNDPNAVVDTNLKVIGVTKTWSSANLRVVGASIFPKITMGDIPCVMFGVADKAADLIISDNLI